MPLDGMHILNKYGRRGFLLKRRALRKKCNVCGLAVSAMVLLSPVTVLAAEAPDAGKTLNNLKQKNITLPQQQNSKISLVRAEEPGLGQKGDSEVKISISDFKFTGRNAYSEKKLLSLLADAKGKEVSLNELEKLAERITNYYRKRGYIMAKAYIPAQRIENGVVEIAVVVGSYDQIVIHKNAKISDDAIAHRLGAVKSGEFIRKGSLEKAIWLLNDLSGIEATAVLKPGERPGTADLVIDVKPGPRKIYGSVSADNFGNRFIGKNQLLYSVNVANPAGEGDKLALAGATAGGGLTAGGISYKAPLKGAGDNLEVGYSKMRYELGQDFAMLDAHGTGRVLNVAYSHNFIRSRTDNLTGKIGFAGKMLKDTVSDYSTPKRSKTMTFTLDGDNLDSLGGGGANSYSLNYSRGHLSASDADAQVAGTAGSFGKWNVNIARQQYISDRLSLVTTLDGQWANKNLDSSEKMSLGGGYGVRAYPMGEAAGDNAYLWRNELRWTIPTKKGGNGMLQLVGFYDQGSALINKYQWTGGPAPNRRTLKGAGVGISWTASDLAINVSYAWKVGSERALADTDKSGRIWVQVTKTF